MNALFLINFFCWRLLCKSLKEIHECRSLQRFVVFVCAPTQHRNKMFFAAGKGSECEFGQKAKCLRGIYSQTSNLSLLKPVGISTVPGLCDNNICCFQEIIISIKTKSDNFGRFLFSFQSVFVSARLL